MLYDVIKNNQCAFMIQFDICYWAKLLRIRQIMDAGQRDYYFVLVD